MGTYYDLLTEIHHHYQFNPTASNTTNTFSNTVLKVCQQIQQQVNRTKPCTGPTQLSLLNPTKGISQRPTRLATSDTMPSPRSSSKTTPCPLVVQEPQSLPPVPSSQDPTFQILPDVTDAYPPTSWIAGLFPAPRVWARSPPPHPSFSKLRSIFQDTPSREAPPPSPKPWMPGDPVDDQKSHSTPQASNKPMLPRSSTTFFDSATGLYRLPRDPVSGPLSRSTSQSSDRPVLPRSSTPFSDPAPRENVSGDLSHSTSQESKKPVLRSSTPFFDPVTGLYDLPPLTPAPTGRHLPQELSQQQRSVRFKGIPRLVKAENRFDGDAMRAWRATGKWEAGIR